MQEIECIMSRERITITKFLTRESSLKTEGPEKTEKFENTALFLLAGFSFSCTRKTFWKQSFSKTLATDFTDQIFLKHKSVMVWNIFLFFPSVVWIV